MNVLSLFDGASCGQIALNRIGIKPDKYFASEIKPHAIQITQKNFPETIQIGDINFVTKETFGINKIDLVIGGSPCQSFSRAGDGSGFNGKSKLFFEYLRVLNEIKETNPDVIFLLENVLMRTEWKNFISEALNIHPVEINSTYFSAQKRRRLYWCNLEQPEEIIDKKIILKDILEDTKKEPVDSKGLLSFEEGEYRVKNATKKGFLTINNYDSADLEFPNSKTRRGRVAIQKTGTLTRSCNQCVFIDGLFYRLTPLECERLQTMPDNYTEGISDSKRKDLIGDGWTVDVICHRLKPLLKIF